MTSHSNLHNFQYTAPSGRGAALPKGISPEKRFLPLVLSHQIPRLPLKQTVQRKAAAFYALHSTKRCFFIARDIARHELFAFPYLLLRWRLALAPAPLLPLASYQ